jgi:hypothetical protein
MRKIIFTAAAVLAFGWSNAQIKTDAGTFTKPTTGSLQIELSFAPSLTGAPSMFSLPSFYGSEIPGVKVRKFISENKAIRYTGNVSIINSGDKGASTGFTMAAGIGVENHLKGAERLSTFWGYEGNIGFQNSDATSELPKQTQFGLSTQVFTGFDYYIMPNIYLGCEINYGIAILNTKPSGSSGTTSFKIQPNVLPAFRLGWRL